MFKILKSEIIYCGKKFKVIKENIILPNGRKAVREIVDFPGASAILPIIGGDKVLLIKQFRTTVHDWILEVPAGTLKPGEDPLSCAKRELREETGYIAHRWTKLASILTSPGYSNEVLHIFLAENLEKKEKEPEKTEVIENIVMPVDEALKKVFTGEIVDGKTVVALLMYGFERKQWRLL